MQEKDFLSAIEELKKTSKQRKFEQTLELIFIFKGIDFKKPENRIDLQIELASSKPVEQKPIVFVKDKSFASAIKDKATIIMEEEIPAFDKKKLLELLETNAPLLAEKETMLTIGKFLGQVLAPKGRMPKPINPEIKELEESLSMTKSMLRVTNRKAKPMPQVQIGLGKEKMPIEELAHNALAVYNAILNSLPGKQQNIKAVLLKFTMSKPVKLIIK